MLLESLASFPILTPPCMDAVEALMVAVGLGLRHAQRTAANRVATVRRHQQQSRCANPR